MQPSHEERTFAALAHASIMANITGVFGLLAAGLIWATQRQRSRYVAAHALQSLWYQAGVILGMLVLFFSWGGCMTLALLPMLLRPELYTDGKLPGPFWLALSTILIPCIFGVCTTVYGLFAAMQAYRGRPFHYPFMRHMADQEVSPAVAVPDTAAALSEAEPPPPEQLSEPVAAEAASVEPVTSEE